MIRNLWGLLVATLRLGRATVKLGIDKLREFWHRRRGDDTG